MTFLVICRNSDCVKVYKTANQQKYFHEDSGALSALRKHKHSNLTQNMNSANSTNCKYLNFCMFENNFCKNGGRCIFNENACKYWCACKFGYTGSKCQITIGDKSMAAREVRQGNQTQNNVTYNLQKKEFLKDLNAGDNKNQDEYKYAEYHRYQ